MMRGWHDSHGSISSVLQKDLRDISVKLANICVTMGILVSDELGRQELSSSLEGLLTIYKSSIGEQLVCKVLTKDKEMIE